MPILSTIGAISSKAWGFARAVAAVGADSLWNYVSLLLSSTTPSGGLTINSDLSSNNFLLTPSGVPYNSANNPFQAGYYGNQFNSATSDYLSTPYNAALVFGTNNFTVECWIYPTAAITSTQHIIGSWDGSTTLAWQISVSSSNAFSFAWTTTGSYSPSFNPISGSVISINAWNHLAAVRNGSTVTIYLNGVSQASAAISGSVFNPSQPFKIGNNTNSQPFLGYVSNARIVNGTAVYTANFTPPTTPLTAITNTALLTCQSARFVDNSTNAFVLTPSGSPKVALTQPFTYTTPTTYASEFFNGSTDYLSTPYNSAFALTADFTIECWLYWSAHGSYGGIVGSANPNTGAAITAGWFLDFNSTANTLQFEGQGGVSIITTNVIPQNQWVHIAVVRSGSTITHYLNGISNGSGTSSQSFDSASYPLYVGVARDAAAYTTGYISNVRIVKGTAVYTANFTPPTTPLTAVANTALLSLQNNVPATNNGFVDSSALLNPITRTSTPTQGSFAPFGTLWSNYFGATGTYLNAGTSSQFAFGTGNFTAEAWIYNTGASATAATIVGATNYGVATNFIFYLNGTTNSLSYYGATGVTVSTASSSVMPNTWYHVAIVRNGTTVTVYINGVSSASVTDSNSISSTIALTIGNAANNNVNAQFIGYISNVRIVNGTAVYTANFTPPTVPLTAITNTALLTAQSNRFVDNSTNAFTLTATGSPRVQTFNPFLPTTVYSTAVQGGSAYFNGTADYLLTPSSTVYNLPNNVSWTVELWVFLNATASNQIAFISGGTNSWITGHNIDFAITSSNFAALEYSNGTGSPPSITGTTALKLNSWNHVAFVYNGSAKTITSFINGVVDINASSMATYAPPASTPRITIGRTDPSVTTPTNFFNGYISNFRVVNGTAVYTAAFTPPTAPLTPIAKTSLLLNTANAGLFDYAIGNDLVTIGSTTASTSTIKYGTGSLYFNGTSNYLTAPNNLPFVLGTTDFTIECWVYTNSSATQRIISVGNIGGAPYDFVLVNSTTNVYVDFFDGTTDITSGTNYVPQNQWVYLAVTRQGTAVKVFINGAVSGSGTSSVNLTANGTATIGRYSQAASGYFSGYISDLRITKGVARYTAAFTPPTTALPNY